MIFPVAHILLTAGICGLAAAAIAWWRLPDGRWPHVLAAFLICGTAVLAWRTAANMPQLNTDGLPSVSANDLAAPVLAYVALCGYRDLRKPAAAGAFAQIPVLAALACLAINIITI